MGLDARRLRVQVQNAVVVLHGTAATPAAREAAARVAQDTPGVRDLCNMLTLADVRGVIAAPGSAFDDITAQLLEQDPALGRFRLATASPAVRVAVAVLAALAWALISVALVVLGWLALILVTCAAISVVITMASHRHRHPKRRRQGSVGPERGKAA